MIITVKPPNKEHFGVTPFVLCKEMVLLGGSKCISIIRRLYLGHQVLSFVERFIILYLIWHHRPSIIAMVRFDIKQAKGNTIIMGRDITVL